MRLLRFVSVLSTCLLRRMVNRSPATACRDAASSPRRTSRSRQITAFSPNLCLAGTRLIIRSLGCSSLGYSTTPRDRSPRARKVGAIVSSKFCENKFSRSRHSHLSPHSFNSMAKLHGSQQTTTAGLASERWGEGHEIGFQSTYPPARHGHGRCGWRCGHDLGDGDFRAIHETRVLGGVSQFCTKADAAIAGRCRHHPQDAAREGG